MEKHQLQAWEILDSTERSVLKLSLGFGKSNLEIATIMGLPVYRVKDIQLRAKKLFLEFSNYFEHEDQLIPKELVLSPEARKFLELTIIKRITASEAAILISRDFENIYKRRQSLTQALADIEKQSYLELRDLILMFDKYNNRRILPKNLQLPTDNPRKNTKAFKKLYDRITSISPLNLHILKQGSQTKPPFIWVVAIGPSYEHNLEIVQLSKKVNLITTLNSNGIPYFTSEDKAKVIARVCVNYYSLEYKSPRVSKEFWKSFKELIKNAPNVETLLVSGYSDKS
jgi:hypothetical protein